LFVGIVTHAGGVLAPTLYRLTWTEGTYERSTGTYVVTPMLTEVLAAGDVDIAVPPGHPHASHINELIEPSTRMTIDSGAFATPPTVTPEEWPSVRLRINPASGTVTWSAPLFNPDAPGIKLAEENNINCCAGEWANVISNDHEIDLIFEVTGEKKVLEKTWIMPNKSSIVLDKIP